MTKVINQINNFRNQIPDGKGVFSHRSLGQLSTVWDFLMEII